MKGFSPSRSLRRIGWVVLLCIPLLVLASIELPSLQLLNSSVAFPANPFALQTVKASTTGCSTVYKVTNQGAADASYLHEFTAQGSGIVYTPTVSPATISAGNYALYNLNNITEVPSGFVGSLTVSSDQPVTATLSYLDCGDRPAAPSGLTATAAAWNAINLSWLDMSNNETGFHVYRWGTSGWVLINTTAANATNYADTGLQPSTTYHYAIAAFNPAGEYWQDTSANATTLAQDPMAPSNLLATGVSKNSIQVTWQDNSSNEIGFYVYRWTGSTWNVITTTAANVTSYSDTGLTPNTNYYYAVAAFKTGATTWSVGWVQGTTLPLNLPPAATNLSATAVATNTIHLTWQDNANNETGYRVYRYSTSWNLVTTTAANVTSFDDTGLAADTNYYYGIVAFNGDGEKWPSGWVVAKTWAAPQPPAAATNLSATAVATDTIRVTWQDNAANETGYQIQRWNGAVWTLITTTAANTMQFFDSGLTPNTPYYYSVVAVNNVGATWPAAWTYATTWANPQPPLAATNIQGTSTTTTTIVLTWQDNAINETGYQIWRYAGSWNLISTTVANTTIYTDTGLNPNTSTYYYSVVAINNIGGTWPSAWIAVGPPAAATNLVATAQSRTAIQIAWSDNAGNELGYRIYRYNGTAWSLASTLPAGSTSYLDSGLAPNTIYYYSVVAYNNRGSTWPSSWVVATTNP